MNNRAKVFVAAGVLAILLALAFKSVIAVNQSIEQRLFDAESFLSVSDKSALKSIENCFEKTDELTTRIARQQQPRPEWEVLHRHLVSTYEDFLGNPRFESSMPSHTALARLLLARLLILQGNRNQALESLNRSIQLAGSVGDSSTVAKAKNTLGCLLAVDGNYPLAMQAFQDCAELLEGVADHANDRVMALRNLGLMERSLGRDGTATLRRALSEMERSPESSNWGYATEFLQDVRMTLCEVLWSQGRLGEAAELARQTRDDLESKFLSGHLPLTIEKHLIPRNRYVTAFQFAKRNVEELESILREHADTNDKAALGDTAIRWQWNPLFDLTTDMVSVNLSVSGTMQAEFDDQTGMVVAWSTLDFSHNAVIEIAKAIHDRTQLVVVADIEESLDEAYAALEEAGVPLDRIRFGISDCETPWFRDQGPIVARSQSGDSIWFDPRLTRDDSRGRTVVDALPVTLRRNWKTRVVDIPIHVEGGMLLSNGKGFTVGAASLVMANREYGFSDQTITRELRRITGATNFYFANTLIGELTEHVDLFLTFVSPSTVVVGKYDDQLDPNAELLDRTAEQLSEVIVDNRPLNVVRIPMPPSDGSHFPSYTNVVFANGILLVPSYRSVPKETEIKVREIYQTLLPEWEIQFIDCSQISPAGGALHCLVSNLGNTPYSPVFPQRK